jgi:hypothetical protein
MDKPAKATTNAQVPRAEFEGLLNERMHIRKRLRQIDQLVAAARARGVEPVTRANLYTDYTMGLGLRARADRDDELVDAIDAWHRRQDSAALEMVLAAMNAEAQG